MTIKTTIKTLESIDRFDLEQDIMACWNVVDDLDKLNKLREYRAELEQNSNDNVDFIIDKNNKNQ